MPTYPPHIEPKGESCFSFPRKRMAFWSYLLKKDNLFLHWNHSFPRNFSLLPHWDVSNMEVGMKDHTCQPNSNVASQPGIRKILSMLITQISISSTDYTIQFWHYRFPNAKQKPKWKFLQHVTTAEPQELYIEPDHILLSNWGKSEP